MDTEYPKPDRSDFVPNFQETADKTVVDLGWHEGTFADGRPYRIESWREGQLTVNTYFFSARGLEDAAKEDLRRLLEEEDLAVFTAPRHYVETAKVSDAAGNELWSVNAVIADACGTYVEEHVILQPYAEAPGRQ